MNWNSGKEKQNRKKPTLKNIVFSSTLFTPRSFSDTVITKNNKPKIN